MNVYVWYFARAAGSAAAAAVLPLSLRGWSLKCILFAVGSLLWSGLDAPWTGLLGATAIVPQNASGIDRFVLVPTDGGTSNLLQEGVTVNPPGASAASSPYDSDLPQPVLDFLKKQNITHAHDAGVQVDLSNDKAVDDKMYREVGGKCPVYGKFIQIYQPERSPYPNDFLADVPTEEQHRRSGNPLPGGFGMTMVAGSGERFSPMTSSRLAAAPSIITAKTPLGMCAQYAFQTRAQSPTTRKATEYRYPFVFDPVKKQCYLLYISMQRMMGKKYCSMRGDSDATWYCFEPMKDPEKNSHLVYGSAYVGQDPDDYVEKCPHQALTGQRFGVWENGSCVDYKSLKDSIVKEVARKEECWVLAFMNEQAASDQPRGYEENASNPWTSWLPYVNSNWPKSHGSGHNYAVFYTEGGKKMCAVSDKVPTCLNTEQGAVSYTALSALEEVSVDYISPRDEFSACNYDTCVRTRRKVKEGKVLSEEEVPCSDEEQKSCSGTLYLFGLFIDLSEGNGLFIAGMAICGVILLVAVSGGVYFAKKKKVAPPEADADSGGVAFEDQQKRRRTKQGDLMQEAEPSFWNEADEDAPLTDQTNVMVEEG